MKKLIYLYVLLFVSGVVSAQSSAYQQQVQGKNGNLLSLSAYTHKKILIAVCSAFTPDLSRLKTLDNLSKSKSATLQVIVIPLLDIDSPANSSTKQSLLLDTANFSFLVCKPGYGKKISSSTQLSLLRWLTNKSGNIHLDNDLQNPSQMFVIGENGILYGELFGAGDLTNGNLTGILNSNAPDN